jgi:hypothetical protein
VPPPPPPSWRERVAATVRRLDRRGWRVTLLAGAAAAGAAVAFALVAAAGLLLQPRFTVLELAAQRLPPPQVQAQPPVETVAPGGAFDRAYVVKFPAFPGVLDDVVDRARGQRWTVVRRGDRAVVLQREGVRAAVTVDGATVEVRAAVAPSVRTRQRQARIVATGAGAVAAPALLWWWLRRRPRLRATGGAGRVIR